MPNHTSNRLTVNGPTKERDKFIEENRGAEEQLSLEQALPTPPEALGSNKITNGSMPTWYNWRVENWGTKWDVFYDDVVLSDHGDIGIKVSFETAWSPPEQVFDYIYENFDCDIEVEFDEPGAGFKGNYFNGEINII